MINRNEILIRLQNGEDAQDIANELAKTLNDAIAEHIESQEAARRTNEKALMVTDIMTKILDFLEAYYPDLYDADLRDFDSIELLEFVEEAIEETRKFHKMMDNVDEILEDILRSFDEDKPEVKVCKCKAKPKSKDPIDEFLKEYVNN